VSDELLHHAVLHACVLLRRCLAEVWHFCLIELLHHAVLHACVLLRRCLAAGVWLSAHGKAALNLWNSLH